MGINCLGRANPVKNLGGCGLFRERKNQEVSRGLLLLLWSFLLILSFGCNHVSLDCFLFLVPYPPHVFSSHLSQPRLIHIWLFTCPLCSRPQHFLLWLLRLLPFPSASFAILLLAWIAASLSLGVLPLAFSVSLDLYPSSLDHLFYKYSRATVLRTHRSISSFLSILKSWCRIHILCTTQLKHGMVKTKLSLFT